jgi:hypothetical protein
MERAAPAASLPSPPPTPRSSTPTFEQEATSVGRAQSMTRSRIGETKREKWDRRLKEFACTLRFPLVSFEHRRLLVSVIAFC